jgi:hypothetical protein
MTIIYVQVIRRIKLLDLSSRYWLIRVGWVLAAPTDRTLYPTGTNDDDEHAKVSTHSQRS